MPVCEKWYLAAPSLLRLLLLLLLHLGQLALHDDFLQHLLPGLRHLGGRSVHAALVGTGGLHQPTSEMQAVHDIFVKISSRVCVSVRRWGCDKG